MPAHRAARPATMGFGGSPPKPTKSPSKPCARPWIRLEMDGTIVIGEGERDEAPMLYIGGKKSASPQHAPKSLFPSVDIAVDPLEGTKSLRHPGAPNAIAVLARQ